MCLRLSAPGAPGPSAADKANAAAQREEERRKRLLELTAMRGQALGRRSLIRGGLGGAGFTPTGSAPTATTAASAGATGGSSGGASAPASSSGGSPSFTPPTMISGGY